MADNKKSTDDGMAGGTKYVTESAPKLPDANVTVTRDEPMIDTRLVEARNAEAKRNADRVK